MAFYWKFTRSGKFSSRYISLIVDATPDAVERQRMVWHTSFEELGMCLMLLQDVEVKNVPSQGPTKPAFRDVVRSVGYEPSKAYVEQRNRFNLVKGKCVMGRHDGEELDWGYYSNVRTPIDIDITDLEVATFIDAKTGRLYGSEDKLSCFRSDPNFNQDGFYYDLMPRHVVMVPIVKSMIKCDEQRANNFFERFLRWQKIQSAYSLFMRYNVEISETLARTVEVEANSAEEAESNVREMYRKGAIVLSAEDHIDTQFEVIEND